jgi:MFS family permease
MRVRALRRLDDFFVLPAGPTSAGEEVSRHFRRNFVVNAADGVFWLLGTSFVSVNAILPVYATNLTDSPLVIGLIPALTDAGWFLPQVFLAPYVERLSRKLPVVGWLGAFERLPYLALAVAALGLGSLPRPVAVVLFLALMAWRSVTSGVVAVPWQELVATVIPTSHRGRFFGTSYLVGQLLGVGGASLAAVVLARLAYPRNFALCFLLGFLGVVISYVFVMMTVEPRATRPLQERQTTGYFVRRLSVILRENTNFRTYLVSRVLGYLGGMGFGFIAVYGVQRFGMPEAEAGVFTALILGSGAIGYAVWGVVGDRHGHKRVMEWGAMLWIASLALAAAARTPSALYLVFGLMGLGSSAGVMSDLNIAMEFGPEGERPTYVGLARTATGPAVFLAPVIGGVIVGAAGYTTMFLLSLALAVAGLAVLHFRVREPRGLDASADARI